MYQRKFHDTIAHSNLTTRLTLPFPKQSTCITIMGPPLLHLQSTPQNDHIVSILNPLATPFSPAIDHNMSLRRTCSPGLLHPSPKLINIPRPSPSAAPPWVRIAPYAAFHTTQRKPNPQHHQCTPHIHSCSSNQEQSTNIPHKTPLPPNLPNLLLIPHR